MKDSMTVRSGGTFNLQKASSSWVNGVVPESQTAAPTHKSILTVTCRNISFEPPSKTPNAREGNEGQNRHKPESNPTNLKASKGKQDEQQPS
jgi:hypothetical protein